jgi:hypothetical protein
MQANSNKTKENSFHFLCRIEAFQWVTADSNKKFPSFISGLAKRLN